MPYKDPEKARASALARGRKYRENNREKLNAARRAYCRRKRAEDPDIFNRAQRIRRAKYPEETSRNNRLSHVKHREERLRKKRIAHLNMTPEKREEYLAYHRQYRIDNFERLALLDREYHQSHLEEKKRQAAVRASRKNNLPHTFTKEHHQFMLQYWSYACAVCGNQEGFEWTLALDHWVALSSPDCPGTIPTNMVPLCHGRQGCNNTKTNKDPHAWLLSKYPPRKVARIEKAIAAYFVIIRERFEHAESSSEAAD